MIVLAIDTATTACSVAIRRNGDVLSHIQIDMARGHAEALLPIVSDALSASALRATDIDAFAVTTGPGAFTGLRVGLAAARGLALATGRPCVGVTTLEAIAAAVPPDEREGRTIAVALDSRRGDLFVQAFDAAGTPRTDAAVVAVSELAGYLPPGPLVIAGDAAHIAARELAGRPDVMAASGSGAPDARIVAALAAARAAEPNAPVVPPSPLYLRAPTAARPVAGGRRRP